MLIFVGGGRNQWFVGEGHNRYVYVQIQKEDTIIHIHKEQHAQKGGGREAPEL